MTVANQVPSHEVHMSELVGKEGIAQLVFAASKEKPACTISFHGDGAVRTVNIPPKHSIGAKQRLRLVVNLLEEGKPPVARVLSAYPNDAGEWKVSFTNKDGGLEESTVTSVMNIPLCSRLLGKVAASADSAGVGGSLPCRVVTAELMPLRSAEVSDRPSDARKVWRRSGGGHAGGDGKGR